MRLDGRSHLERVERLIPDMGEDFRVGFYSSLFCVLSWRGKGWGRGAKSRYFVFWFALGLEFDLLLFICWPGFTYAVLDWSVERGIAGFLFLFLSHYYGQRRVYLAKGP